MINLVLVEPEIPQNTGNIARSCAISGTKLHLVRPLGFSLEEKRLKRAGLDYWDKLELEVHEDLESFLEKYSASKLYLITTKATRTIYEESYKEEVFFLLGSESKGLASWLHESYKDQRLTIPMKKKEGLRSLNLSTAGALVIYEAWRQRGFA